MRRSTPLCLLAIPLIVAAGCGSPSDATTGSSSSSSTPRAAAPSPAKVTSAEPAPAAPDGWASLQGRFVYQGEPPEPQPLSTGGKDGEVCDQHPILDESLLVDAESRGIANVLVYARKVSRVHDSYESTANDEVEFDQKNCVFLTRVCPVRLSQTLVILNSDPIGHNANISPRGDAPINPLLAANSEMRHQFRRQQNVPVPVTCNIHPWMRAYIIPRNEPYYAVTAADGSFRIENLPAGEEIEFQVWHERGAGANNGLEAQSDWSRGQFRLTLTADETTDLGTIEVDASAFQ